MTKKWRNAWTPENTKTDIPSLKFGDTWDSQPSSFWVSDISFIKLKNIQLGYDIPTDILSRLGLQRINVYVNAQNVFTIVDKNYEGFDPERNTFDNGARTYPAPRIISVGVNLNF